MKRSTLTDLRFGKLIAICPSETKYKFGIKWECQCDCGNKIDVYANFLKRGVTKSCGCLHGEMLVKRNTTHGLRNHGLYKVYVNMVDRCTREKASSYPRYGARGVRVCKEWLDDFKCFYDWAILNGWEKGLQLDKDLKGTGFLYSPDSCCFLTPKENSRVRRNMKLTMGKANEIRESKERTIDLAAKYGVGKTMIVNIRANKAWT